MSRAIDERIVEMRFDNKQFESGIKESVSSLHKLDELLKTNISAKSLDDISKAANNINVSGLNKAIESINSRFSALGIAAARVIENLTDGLVNGLGNAIRSTTDSIVSGGVKRAMNIENAHFQLQGLITDEKEVQAIMQQANDSVDGTAYSYDVAAKAASMFAATGIKSGRQMETALKGIAGVAATTNADYERVSQIFTTISGQGRIMAVQLNQFASMGMNAAAALTTYMNKVNDGTAEASDEVRAYIQEITGGVQITEAELRDMVSDSQISFELFSEAMGRSFGDHAKDANKTFTGAMANIRAALARTGAMFVTPLISQDGEFVKFFNAVRIKVNEFNKALGASNGLARQFTDWVRKIVSHLTEIVENFKIANIYTETFGDGIEKVFESAHRTVQKFGDGTQKIVNRDVYTPFHALVDIVHIFINTINSVRSIIDPIGVAFKHVFVDSVGTDSIYKLIESIRKLSAGFTISTEHAKLLENAFTKIFDAIARMGNVSMGLIVDIKDAINQTINLSDSMFDFIKWLGNSANYISMAFNNVAQTASNVFYILLSVVKAVGEAFIDVFGETNVMLGIVKITQAIRTFSESLQLSDQNIEDLKKGFTGIFKVINAIITLFVRLIKSTDTYTISTGNLGDNILSLIGYLGDVLSSFTDFITSSDIVAKGIEKIGRAIGFIKDSFSKVLNHISTALSSFKGINVDFSKIFIFGDVPNKINILGNNLKRLLTTVFDGTKNIFGPLYSTLVKVGEAFMGLVKKINPLKTLLVLLNSVLFTTLINQLKNMTNVIKTTASAPKDLLDSIKPITTEITRVLKAFETSIDAKAIKDIAISIGILSGSILVLSSIDPGSLTAALGAVSAMLGELVTTLVLINKLNSSTTFKDGILGILDAAKMSMITNQLMKLAAAALLLSFAVKSLASLSWEELIKGLIGMTIILAELVGVVVILEKTGGDKKLASVGTGLLLMSAAVIILAQAVKQLSGLDIGGIAKGLIAIGGLLLELAIFTELTGGSKKMMSIGLGMILVSSAIIILAQAVKQMSDLDWEGIGKGLTAVGGLLLELGLFTKLTGGSTNMIAISVGMVILSAALKSLSEVLIELSGLSWEEIAKGLIAIGAALAEVTIALNAMPNTAILKAAGLVILAAGLKIIGDVVIELAKLSWEEIAKGLVAMGGALLELGIALNAIPPWAILGAAGLVITAVGLKSIAESMQQFGGMSWEQIAKGLVAMGGALVELVIALKLVNGNLVGAISLSIVASAISDILPMFIQLGNMKWEEIGKACTAMAAALGILAAAIAILSAIGPAGLIGAASLLAFGVALGVAVAAVSLSIGMLIDSIRKMDGIDADAFLKEVEVLAIAIGAIGLALKTFGVTSPLGAAAMKTVAEALLILHPAILAFSLIDGKTLSETFIRLAAGIAEFGLALKAFGPLSNIGATAFNTIADAISKLAPAMIIFMALDLVKVGEVLNTLGESFKIFGESLKSFGLLSPLGAEAMSICATAVAKLAPALFLLKEIEPDVLATTLQTLADAFKGFGEALNVTPFWFAKTRAEGIGALIDNIPKLVEVLPAFMNLDPEGTRFALETLADAFCAFGEALDNAPFWSPKERGEAIGVLVQEISTLAEVLPSFMALDPEGTKNALDTIGSAFSTFGNALNNAPFWGVSDKGNAIKTLVDSIGTLADGLRNFLTLDAGDVALALLQIRVAFTNFANALNEAPFWGVTDKGNAIRVLVESIGTLADGLRKFLTLDAADVALALGQIHIAFTNFAHALNEAPYWGVADKGNAIKTLVDSVGILVPSIKSLTEIGADRVKTVMTAIGEGFVNFGKALKASPFWGAQKRSDAIVSLVDSLDSLTDSVIKMSQLSYDTIVQILGAMAGGIKTCGDALKTFDKNASASIQAFADLVPIVSSLESINANSLKLVNVELGNLAIKINQLTATDASKLTVFITSLKNFINELTNLIGSNTVSKLALLSMDFVMSGIITPMNTTLAGHTSMIVFAVNNLIAQIKNIAQNDRSVQTAFYNLAVRNTTQYMRGITDQTRSLLNTLTTLLNSITKTINSKDNEYKTLGTNHARLYTDAINSFVSKARTIGENLGKATISGLSSVANDIKDISEKLAQVFTTNFEREGKDRTRNAAMELTNAAVRVFNDRNDTFEDCGENAGEGFARGMRRKVDDVADIARDMAWEARRAIEDELGIYSPSRVLRADGQYTGEGFALGILDRIREVKRAALTLGSSSIDGFEDAISTVRDITEDLDPVITPIVDLTDVMEAADSINDLFNNAIANVSGNVANASNSMNRRQVTNDQQNIQNGNSNNGTNVTFIQNNNSPKALSRLDIYRETRNQLMQFREVTNSL